MFTDVVVTGIGKSVHETGRLTKEGIDSTVEAVAGFTDRAEQLKSDIIWLTATEAARTAENSDELKSEISNRERHLICTSYHTLRSLSLHFQGCFLLE